MITEAEKAIIRAEYAAYREKYPVPEKVDLRGYKLVSPEAVIPAQAGIQTKKTELDSRLRGNND